MNAEQLMEAMGELDASLVADTFEPAAPVKKRPARFWLRFAAAAAVFALVAGGVWAAVSRLPSQKNGSIPALPSETQPTTVPVAEATAAAPAGTEAAEPTGTPPAEAASAAASQPGASPAATAAAPETAATTALTTEQTKATAAPETTAAPPVPETEAPVTEAASGDTASSWWERLFSGAGGLLQRIAGFFSGGSPNGAGANAEETAAPEAEPPAGLYHSFYRGLYELQYRAEAYRGMPVTEKTQAELEALYGGPFLPTVFPGAAAPPQESSGTIHGVRTRPLGDTVAFNDYLFVWTTSAGCSLSLAVTVEDSGYFPPEPGEDECSIYQAGSATVYWLADTRGGEQRHLAIAKRGETVAFTFILTGNCSDEDFLRTVASALGC